MNASLLGSFHPNVQSKVLRYLIGVSIIAPLCGGLIGGMVGGVGFVTGYHINPFSSDVFEPFRFGFSEGAIFGVPTGLLFGLLATWSVMNENAWRVIGYLGGFTAAFSLPLALIGLAPLGWCTGMIGFWIGWIVLKSKTHIKANTATGN